MDRRSLLRAAGLMVACFPSVAHAGSRFLHRKRTTRKSRGDVDTPTLIDVDVLEIHSISAAKNQPTKYHVKLRNQNDETLFSPSVVIQAALLAAIVYNEDLPIELSIAPDTNEIHRVYNFGHGQFAYGTRGKYWISRIATQRTFQGDHLEVFLDSNDTPQKICNVFDERLRQLVITAFSYRTDYADSRLDAEFLDTEIVAVTVR